MFSEFILLPCQIIILLNCPIEGRHSRENAQRWEKSVSGYVNCFSYIVYAFWGGTQLSLKMYIDFFSFCLLLSFFVVRHIPDKGRSQLLSQDV